MEAKVRADNEDDKRQTVLLTASKAGDKVENFFGFGEEVDGGILEIEIEEETLQSCEIACDGNYSGNEEFPLKPDLTLLHLWRSQTICEAHSPNLGWWRLSKGIIATLPCEVK